LIKGAFINFISMDIAIMVNLTRICTKSVLTSFIIRIRVLEVNLGIMIEMKKVLAIKQY